MIENTVTNSTTRGRANGKAGWLMLVGLLTAFAALSTDMYLPALPNIGTEFQAPLSQVNLTLVLFFAFFSISMLFWGPLSDRHGRKPVLLAGVGLYILASLACMAARHIETIIVARCLQAIGSGAASTVALAIVKDRFTSQEREKALAIVGVIMGLAPVLAPSIGALVLTFTSWRGIFGVLACMGAIAFLGVLFREETIERRSEEKLMGSLFRLVVVLRNPSFYRLLLVFAWMSIPILAFIGASTGVYMKHFGFGKQAFSLFFAFNASIFIIGPPVYLALARRFNRFNILAVGFLMVLISGIMVITIGPVSPYLFALSVLPASMASTLVRPPATALILEQQEGDTGAASSLINSSFLLLGSLGIGFMSLGWENLFIPLGCLYLFVGTVCSLSWRTARRKCRVPESFQR